jgi:hypothetical protein
MSDNVYSGNPGLNGLIPKPNEDTPKDKESQEAVRSLGWDEVNVDALGQAYRLGASQERANLSEAIDEYLELGTPDHDLRSLQSFLEWHLGEGS